MNNFHCRLVGYPASSNIDTIPMTIASLLCAHVCDYFIKEKCYYTANCIFEIDLITKLIPAKTFFLTQLDA